MFQPLPARRVLFAACLAIVMTVACALAVGGFTSSQRASADSVTARAAQAPTLAADQRFAVGGPSMQAAIAVAIAHWGGQNPCSGVYTIEWNVAEQSLNASASWLNPTNAWTNAPQNNTCKIAMNTQVFWDFAKVCTVLTHEFGHLLGQPHDPAPNQLMSAMYSEPIPACLNAVDPGAPAPVAETAAFGDDEDAEPAAKKKKKATVKPKAASARKALGKRRAASARKTAGTKKASSARKTLSKKLAAKRKASCRTRKAKRTKRCRTAAKRRVLARNARTRS